MNAANEVAVAAFLEGRIGFPDIFRTISATLERIENRAAPTLDDYINCNAEARRIAASIIDH
jgi:1-deoxy-D-xylulose-5-phosphate reductoisomerase